MSGARSAAALALLAALVCVAPASASPRTVPAGGLLVLGKLHCGAAGPCTVRAPRRSSATVGGKPVRARVLAPRSLPAGGGAAVRLRFGAGALRRLAGHAALFGVVIHLRGVRPVVRVLRARLRRPAASGGAGPGGGGPAGPGGGPGAPRSEAVSSEPPPLPRPPSAVTVSGVRLTWYPRDSWLRYVASGSGAGDGILLGAGASGIASASSPCPDRPSPSDAPLPYTIEFTPGASWYDPLSGMADVTGGGSVSFRYRAHTIDLTGSEPEIQINGAASRAIFRFSGSEGTYYPDQRVALLSLDLGGQPALSGGTYDYSLMRGTLTEDGVKVFAGFYSPPDDDEFGCVSVQFSTP